jgi:TetR/AcrR family transcriptional regulator, cholesterol catabolism regulator
MKAKARNTDMGAIGHPVARPDGRAAIRRRKVLTAASELFAKKGFEATSIRDIAVAAGMMSGSLYYYFTSKENLYIAVQDASVSKIFIAVEKAIVGVADPWKRLEAAAIAHAEAMLDRSGFRVLVTPFFPPGLDAAVRKELVDQRDRFERMMEAVIDDLPLMPNIDRHVFQRHYLGAVNWISVWYNWEGALTPTDVARQIVYTIQGQTPDYVQNIARED